MANIKNYNTVSCFLHSSDRCDLRGWLCRYILSLERWWADRQTYNNTPGRQTRNIHYCKYIIYLYVSCLKMEICRNEEKSMNNLWKCIKMTIIQASSLKPRGLYFGRRFKFLWKSIPLTLSKFCRSTVLWRRWGRPLRLPRRSSAGSKAQSPVWKLHPQRSLDTW